MNSRKLQEIFQTIKDSESNQESSFHIDIGTLEIKKNQDSFHYHIDINDSNIGTLETKGNANLDFIQHILLNYFHWIVKIKNQTKLEYIMQSIHDSDIHEKLVFQINDHVKVTVSKVEKGLYFLKSEIQDKNAGVLGNAGISGNIGTCPLSEVKHSISEIFSQHCGF